FWFFHCHIELHTELGMALIIQSGDVSQMPQPPNAFPKCKNWELQDEPPHGRHGNLTAVKQHATLASTATRVEICSERQLITAESVMIIGIAIMICLMLPAIMLLVLCCLRRLGKGRRSARSQSIRWSLHTQVPRYRSLSQGDHRGHH
ncbi:laccase, partial [Elysia marginata]